MKETTILRPTDIEILWNFLKHIVRDTSPPGTLSIEVDAYTLNKKKYLAYSNHSAIQLAARYCKKKDNPCGQHFSGDQRSDCAHFLAHCLQAGGITIKSSESECPHGLSTRVKEIISALSSLKAANIKRVAYKDAVLGSPAFHNSIDRPRHAVMIAKVGKENDLTSFYAHSEGRCGDETPGIPWYQYYGLGFRIEDYKTR